MKVNNKIIILFLCLTLLPNVYAKNKSNKFENLEMFSKVLYLIKSKYYRDVDDKKLIQGALKGMIETLDPHSSFLDEEIFKKMQIETSGEFGGLGIEVSAKDGVIHVITPLDDTPAYKAGIKAGDKIVEINHESTIGIPIEKAVEKMRGKPKTKITIGVIRKGVEGIKHFTLIREKIIIKPVKFELVSDNYAFLRLSQFQKNSADEIFKSIRKLRRKAKKKGGLKGIILDLRSNPGGLLEEAVKVSSIFLKKGVVVSTEDRTKKNKEIRYVIKTKKKELKIPMVVLINGASASASEIVAGALQDHGRALIMGSRSFGKGSVQQVAQIDKTSGIKLTVAQYMTPKGKKIQAVGIIPDIEVDEFDAYWIEKNKRPAKFVREIDLQNHLISTIETDEEKTLRLKKEREERKKRVEDYKKRQIAGEKKPSDIFKKYDPNSDFQIVQAINYLKGFQIVERIKKDRVRFGHEQSHKN